MRFKQSIFIAALLGGLASPGFADSWESVSETMSTLRSELSVLSAQVKDQESAHIAHMRSLRMQHAELELQMRRERAKLEEIETGLSQAELQLDDTEFSSALEQQVEQTLVQLKAQIEQGIPFRQTERLMALDQVQDDMRSQKLSAQKATLQLWGLMEDERRLSRENSVDRQIIRLNDQDVQVQVARLGLVALFFYTEDGEAGYAKRNGTDWTWVIINQSSQVEHVRRLVDSLSKGVRTGRFELPIAAFEK